jgi:3-hydroxybutyryl-CoA dehydrogenase
MSSRTIGVVGAGQMGSGIAQVFAQSGFEVNLFDSSESQLQKGVAAIRERVEKLVSKSKLSTEDAAAALKRLVTQSGLGALSKCDVIVEAVVENTEVKLALFAELDRVCKPETILASNTSSISITKLAAATKRPEKVVGMHFMHPVPVMSLVELIRGLQTSQESYETILALTKALGKTPITAKFDYPGFIVNRILIPLINEAVYVLMEGISSVEEIDISMKLGTNHPMGPLELADFVGLDTVLAILRILHNELGDDKYRPCPLLIKYVEAGWYGRKSGRGFYRY